MCNSMMHQMCSAHDEPEKCEGELDKLDGKGIFKALLKGDVFTDDFRRNVLKDSLAESDMPEEEKEKILAHLDNVEAAAPAGNGKTADDGPIKPLSIRRAVKDSMNILRGRPI